MKKQLPLKSGGVQAHALSRVAIVLFILLEAGTCSSFFRPKSWLSTEPNCTNGTRSKTSHVWAADQPYKNQPHWTRLPNGRVIVTHSSNSSRGAMEAKTPWISNWVMSTEGRRTLKKDVPRMLLYNLVSPMDYGSSVRSGNVRRRRNKAIRVFLADNLALPLVKSLGQVATNLFHHHYAGYVDDQLFAQRLQTMNSSEIIKEFNLTLSKEVVRSVETPASRSNATLSYVYNGRSKRSVLYAQYTAAFEPYHGYSDQYYTIDDNFPLPTFPADSYPWLWSSRMDATRTVTFQLLESLRKGDEDKDQDLNVACVSSGVTPQRTRVFRLLANQTDQLLGQPVSNDLDDRGAQVTNQNVSKGEMALSAHDLQALEQLQVQLHEFHYDSGLPQRTICSNASHGLFPLVTDCLQGSAIDGGTRLNEAQDRTVYDALTHFYAYPFVANCPAHRFLLKNTLRANCSVDQPCLVQSGVTVYTPSLTTGSLFHLVAGSDLKPARNRAVRLEALQTLTKVAFEGEWRALNHGLQGPSTVWYASHDLDVDEFADAVLGTINLSISSATEAISPMHVFETHMKERVPILDDVVSYYADTNHETDVFRQHNCSSLVWVRFDESELTQLIASVANAVHKLDHAIASYTQTRASTSLYQDVVNATMRQDDYTGSEYTLVGFGFIVPATNVHNVLYRDMKLPVPFHLVLRLVVRLQESHLLLPQESRQLLVCLAMAHFDLSYYRCRPAQTSN